MSAVACYLDLELADVRRCGLRILAAGNSVAASDLAASDFAAVALANLMVLRALAAGAACTASFAACRDRIA
jgi:hypothetical protein